MELFSNFSTNYRIFSEYLGSDGGNLESAFVLWYSQIDRLDEKGMLIWEEKKFYEITGFLAKR